VRFHSIFKIGSVPKTFRSARRGAQHGEAAGEGEHCIAGPAGFAAGPGNFEDPELVIAEINPVQARYHNWIGLANPFADRRVDLFDPLLADRSPPNEAAA